MKPEDLKMLVKDKYSKIVSNPSSGEKSSCCEGLSCCSTVDYSVFSENYDKLSGYNPDADYGLGCGLPTEFAKIKKGDTVIDLGSGAGNDCFVARTLTGENGEVIGVDMTEAMIEKARSNAAKLNLQNVKFLQGDIEDLPLPDNIADVVISNCVLNLVPDKSKAFCEIFRVLKPGGHMSVSDVVIEGELPAKIRQAAELYAGCISGAIIKQKYLDLIKECGLSGIIVQKEKQITLPDEILSDYLNKTEIDFFRSSGSGIYSITVYAEKLS